MPDDPITDPAQAALNRGVISQRLDEHSKHLAAINGSTEKTALALQDMTRSLGKLGAGLDAVVQRLDAEAATRVAMAAALKGADEARRQAEETARTENERRWNLPMQRIAWALGTAATLVGLYFALGGHL